MSRRDTEWTSKDTWQCIGMVPLTAGALLACTGHLSIDDIRVYAHTVQALAVPVAAGVGASLVVLGVLLFAVRNLRAMLVAAARSFWLYRRRWARVLDDLGLTDTTGETVKVPRLMSVARHGSEDVVTVRMLPGQSATDYHERAAALADEFGASSAQVSFGVHRHRQVVIVFNRAPIPRRPLLELEAPKPHPLPLALPETTQQQHQYRPQSPRFAIRLTGVQVRIVWARARRITENDRTGVRIAGRTRYGLRGEMRWATWATA